MQQINYHTNEPIQSIPITLTHKDIKAIRKQSHARGIKLGALIATLIIGSLFAIHAIHAHNRLMDEVHATTYYYNLATQCDTK